MESLLKQEEEGSQTCSTCEVWKPPFLFSPPGFEPLARVTRYIYLTDEILLSLGRAGDSFRRIVNILSSLKTDFFIVSAHRLANITLC